jgi:hypothetical protein
VPGAPAVKFCGVIPDLEVNLTRAGLLGGDDRTSASAAVHYIKNHQTPKGTR